MAGKEQAGFLSSEVRWVYGRVSDTFQNTRNGVWIIPPENKRIQQTYRNRKIHIYYS